MFEKKYKFGSDGLNMVLKEDEGFASAKKRVMIVVQYMSSDDVKAHELLSNDDTMECVKNIIKLAQKWASSYGTNEQAKYKIFNFYAERHFNLSTEDKEKKEHA